MQVEFLDPGPILTYAEQIRSKISRNTKDEAQKSLGQYLTPAPVARFMASLFTFRVKEIRLLDAGAGVGALTAAFIDQLLEQPSLPSSITIAAWEIDKDLLPYLSKTLDRCRIACVERGIEFKGAVASEDFIDAAADIIVNGAKENPHVFNYAILNPPYRKIQSSSAERLTLRRAGIETSNLYTGFLALSAALLKPHGQLVAITPRSFCNGPYFKAFRTYFLRRLQFRHLHTFGKRNRAFSDDRVLQENIIFRADQTTRPQKTASVSFSDEPRGAISIKKAVDYSLILSPDDPEHVIHIPYDDKECEARDRLAICEYGLHDLGVSVSTGRVVDFRARDHLRAMPGKATAPLIYPGHFDKGHVVWPRQESRKPNALQITPETELLLVPTGNYVLVKRFTAKEERRRVVAAVFEPNGVKAERIGFENHLNYFHARGHGLPESIARGLAVYLNSTLVDQFFRQFSGHTQVNASDLRKLTYPSRDILERLGSYVNSVFPGQEEVDELLQKELSAWQIQQNRSNQRLPMKESKKRSLF